MAEVETLEKALPDTGALTVGEFAGQASQKVQLDIDDAPFLVNFEDETLKTSDEALVPAVTVEAPVVPLKFWQRRPVQIAGGGLLVLLLLAGGAVYYFSSVPEAPKVLPVEPTIIVVPSPEQITGPAETVISFEPFMVEQRRNGEVHFLQVRFTAVTTSAAVAKEMRTKILVLRDAIYYYLRNKTHEYFTDSNNAVTIKQDLTDIVNGYLVGGKIDNILFENYIMR